MRRLIYQYFRDPFLEERNLELKVSYLDTGFNYWEYSEQSIRKYAEKCGAEYKFSNEQVKDNLPPFFGIFNPFFDEWCHEYDSICFIDSDILATVDAKNIFDYASDTNVTAHLLKVDKLDFQRAVSSDPFWSELGGRFNSGVVVFPRAVYDDLIEYCKTINDNYIKRWFAPGSRPAQFSNHLGGYDQSELCFYIQKANSFTHLDKEFNHHLNDYGHQEMWNASLIHFHRHKKNLIENFFKDERILK